MQKTITRQRNTTKLLTTINLALIALVLPNAPAQAVQFNFTYAPGTSQNIVQGFGRAGDIWASQLSDNVTINIYLDAGQLSNANALSGTRPAMVRVNYSDYLSNYFKDINSADDLLAFKNMQIDSKDKTEIETRLGKTLAQATLSDINYLKNLVNFEKNSAFSMVDSDNQLKNNNNKIWLTSANAKTLNLIPGNQSSYDAMIMMNSSSSIWDFSRINNPNSTTIDPNKYDFLGVALHEIGHAIGFVSGVDAFRVLSAVAATSGSGTTANQDSDYVTPLDSFRYSNTNETVNGKKIIDFSAQGQKYFSINGGTTNLANFAGNNYQTSHWQSAGVMNPSMKKGEVFNISNLDLELLDVIGWNRGSNYQIGSSMMGNLNSNDQSMLMNTSVNDSGISRSGNSSQSTGVRFWQENYMEASQDFPTQFIESNEKYNETQYIGGEIENASLPELFSIEHDHDDHDYTSVPEPNAIAGLGVMGLWGISKLFQRRRK
jgi:hypothetical protein